MSGAFNYSARQGTEIGLRPLLLFLFYNEVSMDIRDQVAVCKSGGPYKVGDKRPPGYNDWHEWAGVQYRGGLRQVRGPDGNLRFPQEIVP